MTLSIYSGNVGSAMQDAHMILWTSTGTTTGGRVTFTRPSTIVRRG